TRAFCGTPGACGGALRAPADGGFLVRFGHGHLLLSRFADCSVVLSRRTLSATARPQRSSLATSFALLESTLSSPTIPTAASADESRETPERELQVLRASEQRLREMFNHAAVGIAVVDLNYRFVDANQHILSMLGYTLEEFRNLTVIDVTHAAYLRTTQEQVR